MNDVTAQNLEALRREWLSLKPPAEITTTRHAASLAGRRSVSGGGGSAACGSLAELKDFIRYCPTDSPEWEARRQEILTWL